MVGMPIAAEGVIGNDYGRPNFVENLGELRRLGGPMDAGEGALMRRGRRPRHPGITPSPDAAQITMTCHAERGTSTFQLARAVPAELVGGP